MYLQFIPIDPVAKLNILPRCVIHKKQLVTNKKQHREITEVMEFYIGSIPHNYAIEHSKAKVSKPEIASIYCYMY